MLKVWWATLGRTEKDVEKVSHLNQGKVNDASSRNGLAMPENIKYRIMMWLCNPTSKWGKHMLLGLLLQATCEAETSSYNLEPA